MSEIVKSQAVELEVVPVAGRIGAEIRGVELSADLAPEVIEAIEEALLAHKVLFFRGQHQLDDAGQEAFAKRLGELYAHPTVPVKAGTSAVLELDSEHGGRANSWHTDVTFVEAYPKASILRGVVIPPAGGDTVWANTAAAYDDLTPELQELANGLRAVHSNAYDYAAVIRREATADDIRKHRAVFASTVYETEHPVVRVHPQTGERHLLLGHFVKRISGFKSADSERILAILQEHVTRLENTVRWRWAAGDVVIWDNRATQHYAVNDYGSEHRVVRRVTIAGDVPVGIDGRRSVSLLPLPEENEEKAV
ncbi:TauD/TfdA dioxygenase family protein [Paenibacillus methanolicus]|uniref:Alpha-ketoglutarate-dependent sulfate ester dioxygenase n=1 Tax=Paenibacillus methanolicus TaxID=582686 RepID=A0A5S5CCA9_9BACL|nr:TauD/TfdA family dioxygenase [Paenibacillus methanolicus]TYP75633.1 taurine dioxygenase [Paenibacillus methanolicus]